MGVKMNPIIFFILLDIVDLVKVLWLLILKILIQISVILIFILKRMKSKMNLKNTNFNEYLKTKGIKPINMVSKDQWVKTQVFSKFEKAIEDFAKEQFHKGRKVITEGIQIYDESLWEDKSHYKDKPLIIVKTNAITSVNRAINRDGGKFKSIPQVKEYISWYSSANKQIKNLDKNAK